MNQNARCAVPWDTQSLIRGREGGMGAQKMAEDRRFPYLL